MNAEKKQLLEQTYTIFKQLCFYDYPIDASGEFLNEAIMGYGTHIDEKIFGISSFNDLLKLQRDQSLGLEMNVKETPVFEKIIVNGDAAVLVDEILIAIKADGNEMSINCRLTTVMEFADKN